MAVVEHNRSVLLDASKCMHAHVKQQQLHCHDSFATCLQIIHAVPQQVAGLINSMSLCWEPSSGVLRETSWCAAVTAALVHEPNKPLLHNKDFRTARHKLRHLSTF